MPYRRFFKLSLCLAVALSFATAQAQTPSPTTNKDADEALRQKAFDLLESIAGQLSILQSPENRARLGANLADSLWEHDERRARTLLISIQDDINAGLRNQEGGRGDEQRRMVFTQLRVNTVQRIAGHDPVLALSFFRATEAPFDATQSDESQRNYEERAFELRLAKEIAAKNPEIALDLARKSLARGFSTDVIPLLRQLNRKHKEQAQELYDDIVAKLKRVNLVEDETAFYFVSNLARSLTPPEIDTFRFRQVIDLLLNSATANGCNGKMDGEDERVYFCRQVGALLPLIKKVDSARAANYKKWEPEDSGDYSPSGYEELNEVAQDGSIEDVLALAKKYPQLEQVIYWRAIQKAQRSGEMEQARKIATDYVGDPETKRSLMEEVDRQTQVAAEVRKALREIQTTLDGIKTVEERIVFLLFVAHQIGQTDQAEAAKLLDRASGLIDTMKPGKEQILTQIFLAFTYCSKSNARGLVIMETLVPKLNELVGAAAKLDGYENSYLRDGEWNMTREGTLGSMLTALSEHAPYFAWCDFDRAVSVAGQFERPEIRMMAQVKLAQGILAGRPKPLDFGNLQGLNY